MSAGVAKAAPVLRFLGTLIPDRLTMCRIDVTLEKRWRVYQDSNLDHRLRRPVLYPLSYTPVVPGDGIEPPTRTLSTYRSTV